MTQKREKKSKRITLKSLSAQLRSLPEVEVPETLKPRLLAAIPDTQAKPAPANQCRGYPAWDFGVTAAAAVLIFALMLLVNYGLSTPSKTVIMEFDSSLCCTTWNQNSFLYDQNNTYLEKSGSYQLK
ncbi:MAG: anti-sigma factor [Phycisphaerae bacterium]|nr:anti-sigma factor [Phycisphaerae bacterium]